MQISFATHNGTFPLDDTGLELFRLCRRLCMCKTICSRCKIIRNMNLITTTTYAQQWIGFCKEKQILIEIKLLATCTDGFFTETLQSIHDRRTQLEKLRLIYLHFSINSCFLVVGSHFLHRIRNQSKFQKSASS